MIYCFGGSDTYESLNNSLTYAASLGSDFEIKSIDCEEVNEITTVLQEIFNIGLFGGEKIFLLKRLFKNKLLVDYFSENFDELSNYNILIWEDKKPDGKLKLTKLLKQNNCLKIHELPKEYEMGRWLVNKAKERKISLTKSQIDYITARLPQDKFLYESELSKIYLYQTSKKKQTVTDDELASLLGFDVSGDIWKLLESFRSRDKASCILEFEKLTTYQDVSQFVIAMVARELTMLADIIQAEKMNVDINKLGYHPFVLNKAKSFASRFNLPELRKLSHKLFQLDLAIKSGNIDDKIGMTMFFMLL